MPRLLTSVVFSFVLLLSLSILASAEPNACDKDLVGNRWKDTDIDTLPDGKDTTVDFSFTLFGNGSLRADYSFNRNSSCSGNSVVFADSYTFDNETGQLSWNGSSCSVFGDKDCVYCPFATFRYVTIVAWAADCKSFNATRLIEYPAVPSPVSLYVIDDSKPNSGPYGLDYVHISKTAIIVLAVLGGLLVAGMIAAIGFCIIRGDTSRDKYDPIH